ncbi:MAG: hypothetical protein AB8C95_01930 [Phycisphaeraceae bacterium]
MKRLNKNTQMPFTVALTLIFGYGLLLAAVPTSLSATTEMASRQLLMQNNAPQSDHVVTVKTNAADQDDDSPSVQ